MSNQDPDEVFMPTLAPTSLEEARSRIVEALLRIARTGGVDGDHHKQWCLDQVVRALVGRDGTAYERWVENYNGADGDYEWDEGIAFDVMADEYFANAGAVFDRVDATGQSAHVIDGDVVRLIVNPKTSEEQSTIERPRSEADVTPRAAEAPKSRAPLGDSQCSCSCHLVSRLAREANIAAEEPKPSECRESSEVVRLGRRCNRGTLGCIYHHPPPAREAGVCERCKGRGKVSKTYSDVCDDCGGAGTIDGDEP